MNFATYLNRWMEIAELSTAKLSRLSSYHYSLVSKWRHGRRLPPKDMSHALLTQYAEIITMLIIQKARQNKILDFFPIVYDIYNKDTIRDMVFTSLFMSYFTDLLNGQHAQKMQTIYASTTFEEAFRLLFIQLGLFLLETPPDAAIYISFDPQTLLTEDVCSRIQVKSQGAPPRPLHILIPTEEETKDKLHTCFAPELFQIHLHNIEKALPCKAILLEGFSLNFANGLLLSLPTLISSTDKEMLEEYSVSLKKRLQADAY